MSIFFFRSTRIIRSISNSLFELIWYGPDNPCLAKKILIINMYFCPLSFNHCTIWPSNDWPLASSNFSGTYIYKVITITWPMQGTMLNKTQESTYIILIIYHFKSLNIIILSLLNGLVCVICPVYLKIFERYC